MTSFLFKTTTFLVYNKNYGFWNMSSDFSNKTDLPTVAFCKGSCNDQPTQQGADDPQPRHKGRLKRLAFAQLLGHADAHGVAHGHGKQKGQDQNVHDLNHLAIEKPMKTI